MRYTVRRISPLGALFYGLLVGLAGSLIPGALLGWLVRSVVVGLRDWLTSFRLAIPLPFGEGVVLDLTSALPLADTQARLTALAAQETALVLAVAVGTAAAGMLLTGLSAFFIALIYNLIAGAFGGVQVTLDALDVPAARPTSRRVSATEDMAALPTPQASTRPPIANARPAAWLTTADGEPRPLRDDVTRIGSAADNDIVAAGLAPQHAEIRRESGRYLIYDLGSRRTWVNDAQVAAGHMLKDGFRLQLGQVEFGVHIVEGKSGD
jgi:hypothetical protein